MSPARRKSIPAAALLLAVGLLGGCSGARVNLWPVYYQGLHPVEGTEGRMARTVEVAYPFFSMEKHPEGYWYALRPFFNYERDEAHAQSRVQYLWPLGLYLKRDGRSWLLRLWPLFQHSWTYRYFSDEANWHGTVLLLICWGKRSPEGPYFGVFPLGGITHGGLADTFAWALFPLYSYYRQGRYRRHDFLWPFFSWGSTPGGGQTTVRAWPFYVRKKKKDRWQHNWVLWPFLRWGHQQWQSSKGLRRRRYRAFHPFYASQVLRDRDGEMLAYQRQILGTTVKRDLEQEDGRTSWSTLFSLVRVWRQPHSYRVRFWPLFGYQRRENPRRPELSRRKWNFLWPIIWYEKDHYSPEVRHSRLVLAPFYWHYASTWPREGGPDQRRRSITLWPLITRERDRRAGRHLWVMSHGWKDATGGYKRNYRAFFDFFQYHNLAGGGRETRLLWRLYHHKRGPQGRYLSLGPLMTYDGRGDPGAGGKKSFALLGGLLKYYWGEGESRLRLLYLPL